MFTLDSHRTLKMGKAVACFSMLGQSWNVAQKFLQVAPTHMQRVRQHRIYTLYMTMYLVISLPKLPYIQFNNMVLSNPTHAAVNVMIFFPDGAVVNVMILP